MNKPLVSAFQQRNLAKLATYLEGLPADYEHFDMSLFHTGSDDTPTTAKLNGCGAVACAVGHAPYAGVGINHKLDYSWNEYMYRALTGEGNTHAPWFSPTHGDYVWNWLFNGDWEMLDQTHTGAAARIRYYLAKGLPKKFEGSAYFPLARDDEAANRWYKRTMTAFAKEQASA